MQPNFDGLKILFPAEQDIGLMKELKAMPVFDDNACNFLNILSEKIRKDKEARQYPDIVTFGFFCRKANIEKLRQQYKQSDRLGRGLSFHIAPSNVPINFAYSLVAGLLAGNAVIVRVSAKEFAQTKIICRLMSETAKAAATGIEMYLAIVQYEHSKKITDSLSAMCDVRVIWGGDSTVSTIRESKIPSRCVEVTFADRYSVCVLDAKAVLEINDWHTVAQAFYNDTYLYDQNACSSPRLMYWIGEKEDIEKAKELFWNEIYKYIAPQYAIEPVIAVDKLTMDYKAAIEWNHIKIIKDNNLFHRIELDSLERDVTQYTCPGGSFLEYSASDISDLGKIVNKKYQTLSYLGCDAAKLAEWVFETGLEGIDRIVPMGKTADFTLTWDGYNLIETMSRKVYFA